MIDRPPLEHALRRILWELRPYLPSLVVIGGWVPHLYRKYGGFQNWTLEIPLTSEVDVLVKTPLPRMGERTIPEILRGAGFEPQGSHRTAAVWANETEAGDKVEFLIEHTGTSLQRGLVVPVQDQQGLGAMALTGLRLLRRHTTVLRVPLSRIEGEAREGKVRVPRLGIFAVNKAITFPYRSARAGETVNPKRAKDLLYLRDLMAAGEEVASRIENDVREVAGSHASALYAIRRAHNNLGLLLNGSFQSSLLEVAEGVSVRFGSSPQAAESDVRGHLADFRMVLGEVLKD